MMPAQTAAEMFVMVLDVHKWVPMPAIAARAKQSSSTALNAAGGFPVPPVQIGRSNVHSTKISRHLLSLTIVGHVPAANMAQHHGRQICEMWQVYLCSWSIVLGHASMSITWSHTRGIRCTDGEDAGPPYSLLEHMPLAVFTNGLLSAFNELRHCALLSLASPVAQIVQASALSARVWPYS